MSATEPRYRLIACEIMARECAAAIADCKAVVDAEFLPKALHDVGATPMSDRLQAAIDATDPARYDAILLAYGLCNYGVCGLHAPLPLVLPRAHDCLTLLMGSRQRHDEYFASHPGTFYKSPGWLERSTDPNDNPASITSRLGLLRDRAAIAEKYGEENADFLMQTMGNWMQNYQRIAFIDTGVGNTAGYLESAGKIARENGWEVDHLRGSRALIDGLLAGDWRESDYLVVAPGNRVQASWDAGIVRCEASAQEKPEA